MSKPSQIQRPRHSPRPPIEPGDVLAERYRVNDVIGEGGMGIVFECKHLKLGTRVAVKMLLDSASEDEEVRVRFDREARAAAQLKSPHVARVLDVDETQDGRPFMVMEFLQGYGLDEVVDSQSNVDPTEAVDYILQACSGMAEAHELGIVHRDLKPPNLFCSVTEGDAVLKVLDFGISKVLLPGEQRGVTETTSTFGTPTYMSPEQIQSAKNVDARADIWSLGVILYELLVGFPPFDGDNPGAIIWSICSTTPKPAVSYRADLPPGLSEVLMKALEKNRNTRYQTVIEFAEALEEFGSPGVWTPPSQASYTSLPRISHPSRRAAVTVTSAPTLRRSTSDMPESNAPWTTTRRLSIQRTRRALLGGVIAVGLVLGVSLVVLTMRTGAQDGASAPVQATETPSPPSPPAPDITPDPPPPTAEPSASAPIASGSADPAPSAVAAPSAQPKLGAPVHVPSPVPKSVPKTPEPKSPPKPPPPPPPNPKGNPILL